MFIFIFVYNIQIYTCRTKGDKEPRNPAMVTHRQGYMKGDRKRLRETRNPAMVTKETEGDKKRQGAQQPDNGHPRSLNRMLLSRLVQSLLPLALWFPDLIGFIYSDSWSRFLRLIRTLSDLIPAASLREDTETLTLWHSVRATHFTTSRMLTIVSTQTRQY